MKQHHEIGIPENREKEGNFFELELVEKCAMRMALMRVPDVADKTSNERRAMENAIDYRLKDQAYKNIKMGVFKESPEFSQIYLNAATEERDALKAIRNREGNINLKCGCDHKIDDHLRAINSLTGFFEKRLAGEYN